MSKLVYYSFFNLFCLFNTCRAFTHWVVTENGRIQAQENSVFQLNNPDDLIQFLNQEERSNNIFDLFAEMKRRKRELNQKWSQLSAESELEKNINLINHECQELQDINFYDDIVEYATDLIKYIDLNQNEEILHDENKLDCTYFSSLDFSMATFPHLEVLTQPWNLSWAKETKIDIPLSPGQIYNGLNKNKTSWFLYNLASLYWRKAGDSQRAIDCIKRSVHFASREHKYTPLLNLGVMLQKAQCTAEAAILLHSSVDHAPHNAKGHFALANVYITLGDYERSLDCYENALRLSPDWGRAKRAKQAILCHNNLKQHLSQLRGSLDEVLTEVQQLSTLQARLKKDREDLLKHHESHIGKTISQILSMGEKCNFKSSSGEVICKPLKQYNIFQPMDADSLSLQILLSKVQALMDEISVVAEQLASAVELTMNLNASQAERLEAYNACEIFKEKSPLCIQCGLYLAQKPEYSHFVRHFGLQLMEHCIKYRWYNLDHLEKLFIKENAMKLVECGMDNLLEDKAHMRDALSRVVVEMIKREWPQQWPALLAELNQCSSRGCIQTELVLLVLLRLVEDVAVLQTLEANQRRKDIYQALTSNMADLFIFFRGLIEKHYEQYQSCIAIGNLPMANSHARVVQVVLLTLSGFVEWVSMVHIMAEDGRLLQILCLLLNNELLQDGAAECLLQIVSRKGKVDERRPLLILFSEDAMRCIFQAADTSVNKNYQFLKKLTRVLTSLGTQLCSLWSKETESRPPNFEMYLEAIVTFTRHSSLSLVYYANSLWLSLMKHEQIPKDDVFLSFVPKWVEAAGPKIIRVLYPSSKSNLEPNTPEAYAVLDYDAEDEFNSFFHRYRVELLETFKQATLVAPLVTYSYVERWLGAQIQKTVTRVNSETCSHTSLAVLEWDACSLALDAVLSKLVMAKDRPDFASGLTLLDLCITLEPADPLVMSSMLSCISALFVFLSMAPPETTAFYLPRVLDKIFATLVFTLPGEPKNQRSRSVKNLRRHAASLLIKIAQKYPLLLLPVFSRIHTIVVSLQNKPHTLSTMESICLQEAMLLISNHLCDYERQCKFVSEVITPISQPWLNLTNTAFVSTSTFMSYIGLDKPPVEPSTDDTNGQNRSQIMWCLDVMLAVVKRCMWPSDPELAARGGFLVCTTGVGNPIYRNPATPHVLPLLPGLLALCNVLNGLSSPPALIQLSEGYKGALSMLEVEKHNLLGIGCGTSDSMASDAKTETTPLHRMQNFITSVHDDASHTLASAFHSLAHDIYHVPNLAISLTSTVFSNLEFVPDYRLRGLVRVFLKSFVTSCPVTCYDTVLLPVLAHFTPYMFTRLSARWQHLSEINENGSLDEENTDTQEMLEDMLNRTLTREYLDVLKVVLYGVMIETDENEVKPQQNEVISELGAKVLQFDMTCHPITLCLLRALFWADSTASLKCTGLVGGVISFLVQQGKVGEELAAHALSSVLLGLQRHGQHDANLGSLLLLGTLLYGMLRPIAPNIVQVMKQIPDVSMIDLQKLDDRMMREVQKGNKVDKAKKEMFKKVTSPLIGQNVGQLFRKKVAMRDLPRLDNNRQKSYLDPLSNNENCLSSLFRM